MASPDMESPDTVINVGGIKYTLNQEKLGVNYFLRSYGDFRKTFQEVSLRIPKPNITFDEIQDLFVKYMRVEPFMEQDFGSVSDKDRPTLIRILEAYLKYLNNSIQVAGVSISTIAIVNIFNEVTKNVEALKSGKREKSENERKMDDAMDDEVDTCKASKTILKGLDEKMKRTMELELAWLLTNLDEDFTENQCKWAEMVSKLADIRLGHLTEQLPPRNTSESSFSGSPESSSTSSSKSSSSGSERPSSTGLSESDQKYDGDGTQRARNRIVEPIPTHSGGAMNSRIKTLLTVSHIAQMSKKPFIQTGGGSATDDLYDVLTKELSLALLPLFDSIKSMYQPVYGMLESCMIRSRVKKRTILEPLLTLLHISNHFVASNRDSHGIYRIRNGRKDLVHFITTQLQCTAARIQKMTLAKQKKCLKSIQHLSPVIISSLPKRNAVPSIKKAPPLPTVQYITLDGNLTIPPFERFYRKGSESVKESTFQAMTDFFTTDDLYMAYSYSDKIPMNLYEIDFSSVNTKDIHIPITEHDSYFTSHPHHLQDFAPLVENAMYTNGELVLSIFIALKEKRSK